MNLHPKPSLAGIGAGLILFVLAPSAAIAVDKWDMPAGYSAKNYVTKGYIAFAEAVTKNSGGKLTVVVHPSGSLYKASEILRAVRSGQAPVGARYIGAHAKEDPILGIDTVPFLATNGDEAMKLYRASKPALEAALNKRGMKLLFTAIWPPQGLFAKKEIKSVADMKGVKFRAYDAMTVKLARLMGATPTKTEATEIGPGLLNWRRRKHDRLRRHRRVPQDVGLHQPLLRSERMAAEKRRGRESGRLEEAGTPRPGRSCSPKPRRRKRRSGLRWFRPMRTTRKS